MTFLTPALAVAGILGVAIPVIIHLLFRRRKTPIEWAAMRFLIDAFRKHRRRLQLEQLLLLVLRCIIIALLGAALARPLLENSSIIDLGGSRVVYFIVDDGMITALTDEEGNTALDAQVDHAKSVLESLAPGDRVGLITTARPANIVVNPPTTDHNAIRSMLDKLEPSDAPSDLPMAMMRLADALQDETDDEAQVAAYLFSEFREGSARLDAPLGAIPPAIAERTTFFTTPVTTTPRGNIQIVSIDPLRSFILPGAADGSGQTTVRLERHGGALNADITRVRLEGPEVPNIDPVVINWEPGQTEADADFLLDLSGTTKQDVAITAHIDDDALNADNQRHAMLTVRQEVRVVLVERREFGSHRALNELTPGQWIRRALEPYDGSPIEFIEVEPAALGPTDLRATDVAVVTRPDLLDPSAWRALRGFVRNAGLLVVVPPTDARVHEWTTHLNSDLDLEWNFNLEVEQYTDPIRLADEQPRDAMTRMVSTELGDLTRPVEAERRLVANADETRARVVLTFADGAPLLLIGHPRAQDDDPATATTNNNGAENKAVLQERGMVAMLTVSPDMSWSNLPSKPLMVPLFHELVRQGLSQIRATQQVIVGAQRGLGVPSSADAVQHPEHNNRILVDDRGRSELPLRIAGLYNVLDPAGESIAQLPVNVDPIAGLSDTQSQAAVDAWLSDAAPWQALNLEDIDNTIATADTNSPLARIALIALLLLIVVETIFARWFSHAWRDSKGNTRSGLLSSNNAVNAPPGSGPRPTTGGAS